MVLVQRIPIGRYDSSVRCSSYMYLKLLARMVSKGVGAEWIEWMPTYRNRGLIILGISDSGELSIRIKAPSFEAAGPQKSMRGKEPVVL